MSQATLFSAISTAYVSRYYEPESRIQSYLTFRFVLESSKDLKPDPAEYSVTALMTITHILLAMSNQSAPTNIAMPAGEPTFSPSASAVAVNVLWFMSLILSVAVTLVAVLAKEWCYLFMAERTGQMHDQARRRQLRLEGIKRWKLEGVIPALPTLMHLALCKLHSTLVGMKLMPIWRSSSICSRALRVPLEHPCRRRHPCHPHIYGGSCSVSLSDGIAFLPRLLPVRNYTLKAAQAMGSSFGEGVVEIRNPSGSCWEVK